ncbi:hypothetical protein MNBD_GAMMA03-1835 [hydrothermal vent metagenome]|uniref:Uncharacterized protein n=1 Tax=hydrothermal vent metagenome TaxID=652676 RepID=A0A3B0WIU2_9ZZZZ
MLFNNTNNLIYFDLDKQKLRLIQTTPIFENTSVSLVTLDLVKLAVQNNQTSIDYNVFLWDTAILASKGRIPKGTDLHSNVQMQFWPNFPKFKVFRHAIQIAALWSIKPESLLNTSRQLKIPQRYVFTLYCAMNAIGCAKVHTKTISVDEFKDIENGSLFSRIFSRFFKK